MAKLSKKQQLFIEHYLVSFNATRAAVDAGYSEKTAHAIGQENLRKPIIKEVVDARVREIIAQTDDKRAYLIKFWQDTIDSPTTSENGRIKASELLAKYMKMFVDQLEVGNHDDKPFRVTWE